VKFQWSIEMEPVRVKLLFLNLLDKKVGFRKRSLTEDRNSDSDVGDIVMLVTL